MRKMFVLCQFLLLVSAFLQTQAFTIKQKSQKWKIHFPHIPKLSPLFSSEKYSPQELSDFAKHWNVETFSRAINKEVVHGRVSAAYSTELLFKPYPFTSLKLPYLKDSTKYFGGMIGDLFWHQDMDYVVLLYPIDPEISKLDVLIKFGSQSVAIYIQNEVLLEFQCYDKITDGSAWHFEYDQNQQKYIFIELEKKLRYVNWKGLFGGVEEEVASETPEAKLRVLEKLFAANQGLSKISGEKSRPATMEEMMLDSELLTHVSEKVDTKPYPIADEEVEKEKLNQQLLRRLWQEKQREEALAAGRPPPVFKNDDDEDEEGEYQYLQEEDEMDVVERTDDDLGEFDDEEINENGK